MRCFGLNLVEKYFYKLLQIFLNFEGFEDDDEFSFNEEQEQISKAFEKLPHATRRAISEMEDEAIYYRRPEVE